MFSFQLNKLGQIYVQWYIKTYILRYVSACSVGRKTYCPMYTLCNVILNNSPMLSNGHLQLLFCNVIVLLVVLNCYSKIFPNAIQCPIVILQCYPPLGCLAASESLLLSRSLTTFALPLHHLLFQTNIMETGDKTQTHKYNSMQDQVNKKYPDFPTKII